MYKKFVVIISVLVLLFSLNVSALKVSDDFYVYGKQTEELAKIFNMTEKELFNYCERNNITFLAADKENARQIRITEITDNFSKKIGSFSVLEDSEILLLSGDISGFSDVKGEVIGKNGKKYLKTEVKTKDSGGEYLLTQYVTVENSVKTVLSFYTAKDVSTDYIEKVFSSESGSKTLALKVIVVVGIALFSAFALAILALIIKDTFFKKEV